MKKNDYSNTNLIDISIKLIQSGNTKVFEYFKNNYEKLIKNRDIGTMNYIIKKIYEIPSLKDFLISKMIFNLKESILSEIEALMVFDDINLKKYYQEHIKEIIEELNPTKSICIISNIDILEKDKQFVLNFLKRNKNIYLTHKLKDGIIMMNFNPDSNNNISLIKETVFKIVDQIIDNEGKTLLDIECIKNGNYSIVFKIGNKILKMSRKRGTYNIPYDRHLLFPLIRVNYNDYSSINGVIEVTENVKATVNLSMNEFYKFYYSMRKEGKIYTDLKSENLGRLLRKNVNHWKENICNDPNTRGLIVSERDNMKPLDIGDIVILDSDYLYFEGDSNIKWPSNISKCCERRYQVEEKEDTKVKKFMI